VRRQKTSQYPVLSLRKKPQLKEVLAPVRDFLSICREAGRRQHSCLCLSEFDMPSSDAILLAMTTVANQWRMVAVAWHAAFALALLAVLVGWRPTIRVAAYLLTLPLLSVSAAAVISGNPFNGAVFGGLFVSLVISATRLSDERARVGAASLAVPGGLLTIFGLGYPHFIETDNWATYAYAAPLGLLPCPTLSAVLGVTLALGLLGSRRWALTLAAAGLVYGATGVLMLGVTLDYVLLAGALVVIGASRTLTSSSIRRPPTASSRRTQTAA
jgi:hypothetical protein